MSKRTILIGLAVLAVAAVAVGFKLKNGKPKGIAVETEKVAPQTVVQKVSATGKVQPTTSVDISADVSAKITRLPVKEGDVVEKGQLLVELDRERLTALVESAQAQLSSSQANSKALEETLTKAEKDYERVRDLFDERLESQSSLDAARAGYEAEKARHGAALQGIEQARAALKEAHDQLSKTAIYAPISGTISDLLKEEGEIALGSQFTKDVIMVLSNLTGMEALVDVDENDIVNVALGDAAEIEVDALPDAVFHGTVTEIASSAKTAAAGTTDQKTEFEVKVAITDATAALRPGMTASADIVVETKEGVLAVPIQAVAVRTPQQLLPEGDGKGEGRPAGERPAGGGEAVASAAAAGPAVVGEAVGEAAKFTPNKQGFVEAVFVVADGKAAARQVTTGIQSETHIEIVAGLTDGEEVVTGSYRAIAEQLRDGSTVTKGGGADGAGDAGGSRRGGG